MLSKKMTELFERYNGTVVTKIAVEEGIDRTSLRKAALRGDIEKVARGVYVLPDTPEDDFFSKQQVHTKGIYSHESAALLHNYSSFVPYKYYMTFPQGYNSASFQENKIHATMIRKDLYTLGVQEVETWYGNIVKCYDKERTVLDMLSAPHVHDYVTNEVIEDYRYDPDRNPERLYEYAQKMNLLYLWEELREKIA